MLFARIRIYAYNNSGLCTSRTHDHTATVVPLSLCPTCVRLMKLHWHRIHDAINVFDRLIIKARVQVAVIQGEMTTASALDSRDCVHRMLSSTVRQWIDDDTLRRALCM
jgi:hypothetical protein